MKSTFGILALISIAAVAGVDRIYCRRRILRVARDEFIDAAHFDDLRHVLPVKRSFVRHNHESRIRPAARLGSVGFSQAERNLVGVAARSVPFEVIEDVWRTNIALVHLGVVVAERIDDIII